MTFVELARRRSRARFRTLALRATAYIPHPRSTVTSTDTKKTRATPRNALARRTQQENDLLQTIAIILVILWLLGFVTSYTMGGFIHILLVIAIVMILIRVIQGRRVL